MYSVVLLVGKLRNYDPADAYLNGARERVYIWMLYIFYGEEFGGSF